MPILMIRLDEEEYRKLEEKAREHGLLSPEEYLRIVLKKELKGEERKAQRGSVEVALKVGGSRVIDKLVSIIERRVQDMINPFTSKIDDNARKLAMLMERIESVEDRIRALEERLKQIEDVLQRSREAAERHERVAKRPSKKRSIAEILREQGVLFESDIANRIRDRDTFFNKLSRVGAIVLELKGERVAIDPEFWKEFVQKLESLSTNSEDEVAKVLNQKEFRLFERLRESALLYFDATAKRWRLLI